MNQRLDNYIERFSKMIQFETISNLENNDIEKMRRFHNEVLKELYPNIFKTCDVEDFNGSLLIRYKGKSSKHACCFMNHHDVVPTTSDWNYPPFGAKIVDRKMYGRGTLDTKGGLFTMLQACEELISEGFIPEHDIYFESACNEETTGEGCKTIVQELKKRGVRFDFIMDEGGMILYEPLSGVKGNYAMVGLGERSHACIKFIAKSHGGHAATPPKNSPLVRLGKMLSYFEDNQVFEVKISDTIVEMLRRMSLSMKPGVLKFVYKNAKLFKPLLKKVMPNASPVAKGMIQTTIAFTQASGSSAINVMPNEATICADLRISAHEGQEKAIQKCRDIAKKFDVEVEVLVQDVESSVADFNCTGFKLTEKAIEASYGKDFITCPYMMNQCSDARFMSEICDNGLRFTPLFISQEQMNTIHGIDENVDVDCLDKAVDFYKYMMKGSLDE